MGNLFIQLCQKYKHSSWHLISNREDFNEELLQIIKPEKIFIPHWSYIIPNKIFDNYECVLFHMTDLPYGRGGSPLQNLIVNGHKTTKISALRVEEGIDTGPVYIKKELNLDGTAKQIFLRSTDIIVSMIIEIIDNKLKPIEQEGQVVEFKRRIPQHSNINKIDSLEKIYNHIRMMDCKGYPLAFFETEHFKVEFKDAQLNQTEIMTNARIIKK